MTLVMSVALAALALLALGCGGSSKPDYCSNVSDLEGSIAEVKSIELESGAVSTLQTDLERVQTNADAVVSSAKQDFPSETSALKSSVSSLSAAANQLPSTPTPQQLLALKVGIEGTVTAAKELSSATESACE
jgi:hypothetical protein